MYIVISNIIIYKTASLLYFCNDMLSSLGSKLVNLAIYHPLERFSEYMHGILDQMVIIIKISRSKETGRIVELFLLFSFCILKWVVPH